MSSDPGRSESPDADVDTAPLDSTATSEPTAETEPGESQPADRSGLDADLGDDEFSWTGPEVYFPLLIGGLALVAFPDPLTSLVGVVSVVIGLSLAFLDLRSKSGEAA